MVPPLAESVVLDGYAVPMTPLGKLVVVTDRPVDDRAMFSNAETTGVPAASMTLAVNDAAVAVADGNPVMVPFEFKINPVGKDPELRLQV